MNISNPAGAIRSEEAYARGKMLDHSSWQRGDRILPRRITPSDIDMVFDNNGWALFCEISSEHNNWTRLAESAGGQVRVYEAVVKHTIHCAVLCKHSVSLDRHRCINSRTDIDCFQAMLDDPQRGLIKSEVFVGNHRWQKFVFRWYENPKMVRTFLTESALQSETD